MLKKIRRITAVLFLIFITLLFLDFTGTLHQYFGWMAKIQFLPAILALNVFVVIGLLAFTLIFGRVYCSVICPLGVFQDLISNVASKVKKNRFKYSPALNILRYSVLGIFVIALIAGIGSFVALLAPYSSYGRIVSNLFAPVYQLGNNLLAYWAERKDSYMFYETDIWIRSISTFITAALTLVVIFILAWRNGRTYCNAICPVGTVLGYVSKFSLFKHRIDLDKCNNCGLCARNCKSSCIDSKNHVIDYSRCVSCFDCIDKCKKKAIRYEFGSMREANEFDTIKANSYNSIKDIDIKEKVSVKVTEKETEKESVDSTRRNMLTAIGAVAVTSAIKAQETKVDGGLAFIEDKKIPNRQNPIVPAGSKGIRHFGQHCTACQLCVSVCPNNVLRPSTGLTTFMQPEMSYERGYCRPECTKCSEVCPAGAISQITREDKSSTQIGHAVWIEKNCVVITDGVSCGNCERHCPVGAIRMINKDPDDNNSPQIPIINTERCIGCGACENLCPSRPFSAIYVEGHNRHRIV